MAIPGGQDFPIARMAGELFPEISRENFPPSSLFVVRR